MRTSRSDILVKLSYRTCSTDVARGVGGPGDAVDGSSVVAQSGHGNAGDTHVQDYYLHEAGGARGRHIILY